jgi:hypothetical protein
MVTAGHPQFPVRDKTLRKIDSAGESTALKLRVGTIGWSIEA